MNQSIAVQLTLEQLEVIADALEFTGQCIEEEIKETEENSSDRRELVLDLEEITATLSLVANAMDSLVEDDEA